MSYSCMDYGVSLYFFECVDLTLCSYGTGEMQQSPVPGHLQHLLSVCKASATLGPQCSSGLPSVTIVQIFHFLQLLCKFHFIPAKFGSISTPSFQLCKDLFQTDSSFDPFPLFPHWNRWWRCVTDSRGLVRHWVTPQPQPADGRKKMVVQRSRCDSPEKQGAHTGEWGGLGGKWLPWRCLYNWGDLTQSLAGVSSSPHCLGAFPLSSSQSSPDTLTLMKATPRICIQITFSGSVRRHIHPCFDLHKGLLEKWHPPVIPWIFLDFRVQEEHGLHTPRNCWESPQVNIQTLEKLTGAIHTLFYEGIICQCREVPTQPLHSMNAKNNLEILPMTSPAAPSPCKAGNVMECDRAVSKKEWMVLEKHIAH